jgi:hypothetical protein
VKFSTAEFSHTVVGQSLGADLSKLFGVDFAHFVEGTSAAPDVPVALLLDDYPNAAAAFSLRQLRTGVTNVVRVRRTQDDAEQDFTAAEITDGTLASWVGVGNDGFVVTFYDQSLSGYNLVQPTTTRQPKIIDDGALIMVNGKPCLRFETTTTQMFVDETQTQLVNSVTGNYTTFAVSKKISSGEGWYLLTQQAGPQSVGQFVRVAGAGNGIVDNRRFRVGTSTNAHISPSLTPTGLNQLLVSGICGDGFINAGLNGVVTSNTVTDNDYAIIDTPTAILGSITLSGNAQSGRIEFQEQIMWPDDLTMVRAAIEANLNDYYGVY